MHWTLWLQAILWPFTMLGLITVYFLATRAAPGQDQTARFMNGIFCWWSVMKQRPRLFNHVVLESWPDGVPVTFDSGASVTVTEGGVSMNVTIRRPFGFLDNDLMETVGFRRDDGRTT